MPFGFRKISFTLGLQRSFVEGSSEPTYSISYDTNSVTENAGETVLNFTLNTTNVADGTVVYFKYLVNGIDQGTIGPGPDLDGNFQATINSNTATWFVYGVIDLLTEGTEYFNAYVYTDEARTNLVATSEEANILDTSTTPPSFTFVSALTNQLSTSVTIPADSQTGDLAVLFDMSTSTTLVVPSGWTSINSVSTTGIRTTYSYRYLTAGQPGTSVTGMGGTTRKVMLIFRPSAAPATTNVTSNGSQATTATPTNQSVGLLSINKPNIVFAVHAKTLSTTPTLGWSQTGGTFSTYSAVSTSGIYVRYQINNVGSSPQNLTISMSDAGTNTMQLGHITFT
jgi:hypothetical protein